MKNGRDLVSEAVTDAKALKEAALKAAKNELLESMAPALKTLLEGAVKEALSQNEDSDRMRRGVQDNWPGESHTGFEEAKEKGEPQMDKDMELESLANFFPSVSEKSEEEEGEKVEESDIPTLGEGEECGDDEEVKEAKEKEDVDEEIEISEAELRKVFEAALQTEVQVKKGFSDMTKAGELDAVVKDAGKGLNPEKKGEHMWDDEEPAHKQDFTVKEMIQKGLAENKALRAQVRSLSEDKAKLVNMARALAKQLAETNLFNAKVLHVNKVLTGSKLTNEQKRVVIESFDKAKTVSEVKTVYDVIKTSFAANGTLAESRKPKANAQRARTSGGANQKVLRESVDREAGGMSERLKRLAGITK